jgi:hypothetical protein
MAVNLSFIGGAGWQFFDDNGDPLSGGKIYTYAAGTTSPLTTYTSRDGLTPNANPIVLDAAGRTPQEIWSTEGLLYKYVVKTSTDVLIRSWDNIGGSVVSSDLAQDLANTTDNAKGDALIGFRQSNAAGFLTGAVGRTVNAKLQEYVSAKDFGAVGDGVTDDTAAIQAAFDSIGAVTAGAFQEIAPKGITLYFPAGQYLVTSTLLMPSNVRMQGTGMGTQFKFNPTTPGSHFLQRKNNNVGGGALNRSNFSMHFENFLVFAARDGGTITGRNGSALATINTNTADCFNLLDCAFSSFTNVTVTDFWYGTAFNLRLGTLFAFYNYLLGCNTRDCKLSVQTTSACQIENCSFSHGTAFPPVSLQPSVQYMVSFDGFRGCAMVGGALEGYCSAALIKNNGAGHSITGVYMEADAGNAMMDASVLASDTGGFMNAGNSYGFTPNVLFNENIAKPLGSSNTAIGNAFNFGDCSEIEIEHFSTRQSPSFRDGLPGRGHFPAGGTLEISTDSFIDNTSMKLTRGPGTAATNNQMSYNFVVRTSEKVLTNVWVTFLAKIEGGENNFTFRMNDVTNGNSSFKKYVTYNNGWALYAGYLRRLDNAVTALFIIQNAGSTDANQSIKITALRAYTNGFLPVPAPYKWQEYRSAVPTTGTWKRGDIVWNSQPSALGTPGWMCTSASDTTTGSITSGATALTVTSGTGINNGDVIAVAGAGVAGATLTTTVSSGGGTTTITLAAAASTTVTGAAVTTPGSWSAMASLV